MMNANPIEIISIGAGGIVKDAHLPAYKIAGYPVIGIFDVDFQKATLLAEEFNISQVFESMEQALGSTNQNTIFDLAVPGKHILDVLETLPDHASVLIQKPMGEDLKMAREILRCCRSKNLNAAVNFQLRYAPFITRARELIGSQKLGAICDIEIIINVYTPWHLWDFLKSAERVEILYHSIHYVDLVRSFLGNPQKVYAKSIKHPKSLELASVRSAILMDYGDFTRANILTNHNCGYDQKHQCSTIKIEGTKGGVRIEIGLLKNYPEGTKDRFEYILFGDGKGWREETIHGTWFPHAFIGSMRELIEAKQNPNYLPNNRVEDCIDTMAAVEAAYISSQQGGISPDKL